MKRQLGILTECLCERTAAETMKIIKDTGFTCTFTNTTALKDVAEVRNQADKYGITLEFIHAPFVGINNMWLPGEAYRKVYDGIIESIDSAAEAGGKMIILHASSGFKPPEICDLGLSRYDAIVDYAGKRGVNVAIENLRKVGNTAYLMDRYEDCPHVKFCYDVGHEHGYTVSVDWMDICGERIACTHVHDNHGRDKADFSSDPEPDEHLLPFDGNIDYAKFISKLDEYGYNGSIMLEVNNKKYRHMSDEDFVADAFARAQRINNLSK